MGRLTISTSTLLMPLIVVRASLSGRERSGPLSSLAEGVGQ